MRLWLGLVWVVGLFACAAGSYLIESAHPFASRDANLLAIAAPVLLWILIGVMAGSRLHGPSTLLAAMPVAKSERAELLRVLKEHGLAGRRARYRSPLYVLTGPPGMGKSSLLERSGIAFAAPVEIGTSTWWIADGLICVETSTAAETEKLSALLKSWRPALPLNGVILAVSCADLTIADKVERRDIATILARWLRQFEQSAGARLPAYLLLTKLDLTPGFSEFFDSLEPQDKRQPWGFTLPLLGTASTAPAEELTKAIQTGFRRITDAIKVRLVECLSRETDPLRCGRIQAVGAQIATFEPLVSAVLAPALEEKTQKRGVLLRGIYLTSARQEALTIDVLLPELAGRFAMPRSGMLPPDLDTDEAEQGYFIAGAVQKGILPEAGLIARQRPWRRRQGLHAVTAVAIVLVCAGLATLVTLQYREGVRAAALVDERTAPIARKLKPAATATLPAILAGLDDLRRLRSDLPAPAATPVIWPTEALGAAAGATYENGLSKLLVPHLTVGLETDLGNDGDIAALKNTLAASGQGSSDIGAAFQKWLASHAAVLPEVARAAFASHGQAAFQREGKIPIDRIYIDTALKLIAARETPP